jgi:hypothetical protein
VNAKDEPQTNHAVSTMAWKLAVSCWCDKEIGHLTALTAKATGQLDVLGLCGNVSNG